MAQQQAIHKFTLGQKEVEGKPSEFCYDKGWYSIVQLEGEERNVIYRSRNAQEAYMKWNVYIGRKKERPVQESRRRDENGEGNSRRESRSRKENRDERGSRNDRNDRNDRSDRGDRNDHRQEPAENRENRENRSRRRSRDRRDNRRQQQREKE